MSETLEALFRPKSVALVGASANPAKLSHIALKNLSRGRFELYPVNPREQEILGLRCYPSVIDVPETPDIAIVSLPAGSCLGPVRECVQKRVRFVIVTSSGFRESGAEGAKLEDDLARAIEGSSTRMLGPNSMGLFIPSHGLDTFFIPTDRSPRPSEGTVALVSQSGAVAVSFMEKARTAGVGLSACVGLGNKSDIDENEVMRFLAEDSRTKCICLYLESFSDGRRFVEICRRVFREKPVVLLKSGRTESGVRAAASHTGALSSSSDSLVSGALSQAGAVRVWDEEELLDVAKALATKDRLHGDRICVVASAGGYGVIATDYVESGGGGTSLRMARLSESSRAALEQVVPSYSSTGNPVDLTAAVTDEMYDRVLKIVREDEGVDGVMMSLELQPPNITMRLVSMAEERSRGKGPPVVISLFGGDRTEELLREFYASGVPAYPTIRRAVRALGALSQRGRMLDRTT